ncbi:MAG: ABC transporter permease [Acidimicrobiales bacterium]|nr:ABC transporter permease [Acidimicrobiales bacterium]
MSQIKPLPLALAAASLIAAVLLYSWDGQQTEAVVSRAVVEAGPLLLGALCGLLCERSGVINIGIEGMMLMSAFAGFFIASYSGSIWFGMVGGLGMASLTGLFLAWTSVTLKQDQIIAGTIINIFALGFTSFYYVQGRTMASIPRFAIPGLADLPLVGPMLFDHGILTFSAMFIVVAVHLMLYRTRWGLRTRAIGEHPSAADTVGVNVITLRYRNVIIASLLAGVAGLHLLQSASSFQRGMTNGKGFIALAVMLFGRYRPFGAMGAALLFGLLGGIQAQLQFKQALDIPPQFFGMIPYLLTIIVLAAAGLAARPPAAAGTPYEGA